MSYPCQVSLFIILKKIKHVKINKEKKLEKKINNFKSYFYLLVLIRLLKLQVD